MGYKARFKLEFDIKTDYDKMEEVLKIISDNIFNELERKVNRRTKIDSNAKIIKIDYERGEE